MLIFHTDDDALARELVATSLQAVGHEVYTLDSSQSAEMTRYLKQLRLIHGEPQVFILDGHNILLSHDGHPLYDMTPFGLISWLRDKGFSEDCLFILYSNDDKLVEQVRKRTSWKFYDAVTKTGSAGGIRQLLKVIERVQTGLKA